MYAIIDTRTGEWAEQTVTESYALQLAAELNATTPAIVTGRIIKRRRPVYIVARYQ